jgi:hypothetical protein
MYNDMPRQDISAKNRLLSWRACIGVVLALSISAAGIILLPASEGQIQTGEASVNNMHCVHRLPNPKAALSGPPYHDNAEPVSNLRGDCLWFGSGIGDSYSVAPPTSKAQLHSEIYLKSGNGQSISAKACYIHGQWQNFWTDWECGGFRSTSSTTK